MNVLVLAAGSNDAFEEAGYQYPKNLVEIDGEPLIERVIRGLQLGTDSGDRFIFVVSKEENRRFHTGEVIRLLCPGSYIIESEAATAGAACTALLAIEWIDNGEPLVVVNGDIVIGKCEHEALADFAERNLDGGIVVFSDVHPRWSFVKLDAEGYAIECAEKRPISKLATTGFYFFRKGSDFVESVSAMLRKNASVNGLYYICPAYNEMILRQKKVGVYEIPKSAYLSLAHPNSVRVYEERLVAANSLSGKYATP